MLPYQVPFTAKMYVDGLTLMEMEITFENLAC